MEPLKLCLERVVRLGYVLDAFSQGGTHGAEMLL